MPGFDGTGPYGVGPMTGRGLGYCEVPVRQVGQDPLAYGCSPQYVHSGPRFGYGLGRGRGMGFGGGRRMFCRGWRRFW